MKSAKQKGSLQQTNQPNAQVRVANAQSTKEWHKSMQPELRIQLVQKMVQVIFPTTNPAVMLDKRMHDLITYAEKVEDNFYEMANSKPEYYQMLVEKIFKIRNDLAEKRLQRQAKWQQLSYDQQFYQPDNVGKFTEITPALRNQSLLKILQAICPTMNSAAMFANRTNGVALIAKRIENELYEMVNSRSEYDRLLNERISKLKHELEENQRMMHPIAGTKFPRMAAMRFNNPPYIWPGPANPSRLPRFPGSMRSHPMVYIPGTQNLQMMQSNHNQMQQSASPAIQRSNSTDSKGWRDSLSSKCRNDSVYKLLQAMFPDPVKTVNEEKEKSIANAKKIEGDVFKKANSESEYYASLLEKTIEFRKGNNSQFKLKL